MSMSMIRVLRAWPLVAVAVLIAGSAFSQEGSYADLWKAATAAGGHAVTDFPDFIMVRSPDGLTLNYFTKEGHFAHPGVITRTISERDDAWYSTVNGRSFGSDAAQPAFKRWLQQFVELDRQMKEVPERENKK
jgi:hypothetical protein